MSHHLAILAYGSLLTDPGQELEPRIVGRKAVRTPFAVEYARSSRSRAGAPTLVPIPQRSGGVGGHVQAQLLLLADTLTVEEACDMLYRREIHKVGSDRRYDEQRCRENPNSVCIERLTNFAGVAVVLYTALRPNLDWVLSPDLSTEEKAERLACLAIGSITEATFHEGKDGICYLADNICYGIRTPLTAAYREAILRLADNAPDLETARLREAQRKGILKAG